MQIDSELNDTGKRYKLSLSIIDPYGKLIDKADTALNSTNMMKFSIPNLVLWDADNPNLYTIKANILCNDKSVDESSDTFGMRKVEARNGRVFLNGRPIYLMGALDQDFYPSRR